jgi:membrane protein YdbS with pleckstrin-like domain
MDEPFDPPGASWVGVDPALRTTWLVKLASGCAVLGAAGLVVGLLASWTAGMPIVGAALIAYGFGGGIVDRQVQSWGYDVGADALTIRHGVMFRELVVVPYARIQFVDVQAGPLERRFGIATVQLHTASSATDARIPGLAEGTAAKLRDELASLGETRSVGL